MLRTWLTYLGTKFSPLIKRCKVELADPLENVKIGVQMEKVKNPLKVVFSQLERARVADIEREININVQVKSVMIEIEEAPVFSENTRVDVDLITKLMKLAGFSASSQGTIKNVNNNLSSSQYSYKRKVNSQLLIYKET